jgi:hypothetical protein
LNLTPSGILQYEDILPYPDLIVLRERLGFSDAVVYSYAAQLYLRKRLNKITGSLYDPNNKPNAEMQKEVLAEIEEDLGENSTLWLGEYNFDRNGPPAKDILAARIRAKFWGANVITYRPSIKAVLEMGHKRSNTSSEDPERAIPSEDGGGWATGRSDARNPSVIDQVVFENAKKGIDAVIKSTMAFHSLEDRRFIITNVFGTAHAYVSSSPHFCQLILKADLKKAMGQPYHAHCCLSRSTDGEFCQRRSATTALEENDRLVRDCGPRL